MSDGATISSVESGVEKRLRSMLTRSQTVSAYLNSTFLDQFKQAQLTRFSSENSSEGKKWARLDPAYLKWKKKKFAAYPGAGNAIMIRTDHLRSGAAAEDSNYYYKAVTNSYFVLGVSLDTVPYAGHAGDARPYMSFSRDTMSSFKRGIRDFITKNKGGR